MKKYLPAALAIAALLLTTVFAVRSCKITDDYSRLKGAYEEARRVAEADHAAQLAVIAEAHKAIAEKDAAIAESGKAVADLRAKIGKKDAALGGLSADLAAAKTDAERVPILTSMVETWAAKYADLEGVVAEKDTQLAAWAVKYAAAVTIGDSWKAQYEAEHRLRLSGETLNKVLEGKYKRAKAVSTITLYAAGGYASYKAGQFIVRLIAAALKGK